MLDRLLRHPAKAFGGGIPSVASPWALQFDGINDRVSFGVASALGATDFTIETWFMRQGPGVAVSSGTGGVVAVPLVTKGMAEAEGSNKDMNYFLGIDTKTGALAADFEEFGTVAPPAGNNHPIIGTTRISDGVWYHAAATYDSTAGAFRLYLNGAPEASASLTPGIKPRFDSIQHAALGTAFTSTGSFSTTTPPANGAFQGQMDEVRIWNVARSASDINATKGGPLTPPQTGLIGRWALDEGTGTTAFDSAGTTNGTLGGSTPALAGGVPVWVDGAAFDSTPRPAGDYGIKLTGLLPGTSSGQAGDYVSLGPAPGLGVKKFTLEAWIKRTGGGTPTATGASTSSGTLTAAIPLITKGMAEADGSNVDANYFFGINQADGKLAADFEDMATGANHRGFGLAAIAPDSTWHHVAVTFDGTSWQFYLDGMPDGSPTLVGSTFVPRFDSIQYAAIGTALNSTGGVGTQQQGYFAGVMDEVRIWNYARTGTQIFSGKNREISAASGLLGRWGFREPGQAIDSTGHANGTLFGSGWTWVSGATPLPGIPNAAPVVNAGPDLAVAISGTAMLTTTVTDDGVTGGALTFAWTQTSGPGNATFVNPAAQNTSATFSVGGTYVLTLTASDGELSASDDVSVVVTAPVNQAPTVDAGPDQAITLPTSSVTLTGIVSDDGLPGPSLTTLWSKVSGPGSVTFANAAASTTNATFALEGTYVLQLAANDSQLTGTDTIAVTVNPNATNKALMFGGTNAFVTFGPAPQLGASTFTLESWIRRDGTGIATFSGTGGVTAVPIVTKGMAEAEGSNVDMNYFLGISSTTNTLVADFEDMATGLNHPVAGTTAIPTDSSWHHVAASYDGTTWRLYVDGTLQTTLVVGAFTPRFDSIQHAAIGTALNSTGGVGTQTQGFFNGAIDEVRIWNYARSTAQISSGRNREIPVASGLLGRWGLNEGSGSAAIDSSGTHVNGVVTGSNWSWVSGGPFSGAPNAAPSANAGADQVVTMPTIVTLNGSATDDGITGTPVTTLWTKTSGPGSVIFANAAAASTTVDFTATGSYVLTITASDGELSASDDVTINVGGVVNQPPTVDAGPDQTVTLPTNVVALSGTATDDGIPGAGVTTLWTKVTGPGAVTFGNAAVLNTSATFAVNGTYVLQLAASDSLLTGADTLTVTVNPNPANKAIQFGGTNAYVTFGPATSTLGAKKFTLEAWIKRTGAGVATATGASTSPLTLTAAIPLVTKGMAEADGSNVDANYFFGINQADGKLAADFEDTATGGNHRGFGQAAIAADSAWHHVAVTFDGAKWQFYLDGAPDGPSTSVGNFTPRFDSIQHAAIGTALNSTGGVGSQTQGFFAGTIDEVRIWNYARSSQQISHGRLIEIPVSTPGLLARWGTNEGSGTAVGDSSGHAVSGTVVGANFSWVAGAPFVGANANPTAVDDAATATEDTPATIAVLANDSDADGDPLALLSVGAPAHGTAAVNPDGTITYTPALNYNGTDTFTYVASDTEGGSATATVTMTIAAVNDAPTATGDTYTTSEDTALSVAAPGVLTNDHDVDGDAMTAVMVSTTSHGALALNADGSFNYMPDADYNGSDSFSYKVSDGTLTSNTVIVSIAILAVNDAPVARADSFTLDEDTTLVVAAPGVLSNDTDAEGDSLSAMAVTTTGHGSLTLGADGSIVYTPAANFNGTDSFTYSANDGTADSVPVTVTLIVNPVNDAPVANNDSVVTDEDTAAVIAVLANDSDVDGDIMTVTSVSAPAHGIVAINGDGTITYSPTANYNGPDGFSYTISDGHGGTAGANVAITVTSVNDPPVAVDDAATTLEDTPVTIAVLSNDFDVDGDVPVIAVVGTPPHGGAVLNGNGTITYTPAANFNGSDSFQYTIADGHGGLGTATVTIAITAVNDAPVAVNDSYSTNEDTPLVVAAPGFLSNDSDVDGDPLAASLVGSPSHGTLVLGADGSFTYTPVANFNGSDSFTYQISDGSLQSAPATVTIAIAAVNDAPVAINDSFGTNEDTPLIVNAPGLLGNDTDTDSGSLTAILLTGPTSGTLTFNSDGSFSYQSNADFNGTDSFTYKANDGSTDSASATVTIVVTAVDDVPQGIDDHYGMNEDNTLSIAAPGVLGNDLDADTPLSGLSAVIVSGPTHGGLTLNLDGSFSYSPDSNYNGTDSFTYKVSDGTMESTPTTVNITINPVNDAPVANPDSFTANEDTALSVIAPGVLGNDIDVDHDPLTASLVSGVSHGTLTFNADGSFDYMPGPNYNGQDSFSYSVSDGTVNSNVATVTITTGGVNDPPVASDDNYAVNRDTTLTVGAPGVLGNDTDADGNALTAIQASAPSHGTLALASNGSFSYTPTANYSGADSFSYRANDGTIDSNVATVTLVVNAVNHAPVAAGNTYSANENTTLSVAAPGVLGNDTDADGNTLTAILVSSPGHGTLTFNANGSFVYASAADYNGPDSFTYKANDGLADSNVATVAITINPLNTAPTAANDSYSTNEDTALTIAAPGVLGNDTDIDSPTLTAVIATNPAHGALTLNANGSFTYMPAANYHGADSFTYMANDGQANSNVATVTIAVLSVNDAPVANDNTYTKNEDATLTVAAPGVLGNDSDVDGDPLTAILVSGPSHGTLTFNANGSFAYASAANYNGSDSFTYKANDGQADSNVATVTIKINPVNDAPVAANDSYSTNEDTALTIAAPGVLGNDTDIDSPSLKAIKVTNPGHGTLTLSGDGSFTYTPNKNYNGTDSFTYKANDGLANSNTVTVTIAVIAVNDPPVANTQARILNEDGSKAITLTATDVDGNALTYSLVTQPAHGTLTGVPPSVTYVPAANYNGPDSFTFKANDGLLDSNIATVSLTINPVNDAPVAQPASYTTTVNTPVSGQFVATDVEGSPLTYFISNQPSKGIVTVNPTTGAFTYSPNPGKTGSDSFRFKANDGTVNSNAGRIDITIR